jgi:hypothetical protein
MDFMFACGKGFNKAKLQVMRVMSVRLSVTTLTPPNGFSFTLVLLEELNEQSSL